MEKIPSLNTKTKKLGQQMFQPQVMVYRFEGCFANFVNTAESMVCTSGMEINGSKVF